MLRFSGIDRKRLNSIVYSDFKLWLLVFLITLFIIFLVQLVLLPHVFKAWHAGNGLLIGGDWLSFHRVAVEIAGSVKTEGWSAWELRPNGWLPAGIAAAVYALTIPEPWTLAPLNAAIHAITFLVAMKLLLLFTKSRHIAFLAAVPFAFLPSAMLWYTQIHRDGYNILGMLLFLYGLLLMAGPERATSKALWGFFYALVGAFAVWLVRPYSLTIFYYTGLFLLLIIAVWFAVIALKDRLQWKTLAIKFFLIAFSLSLVNVFSSLDDAGKYLADPTEVVITDMIDDAGSEDAILDEVNNQTAVDYNLNSWQYVRWVPDTLDNYLYSVAILRMEHYPERYAHAGSAIDSDAAFYSVYDFISYLPRALQIAFLAPFPQHWLEAGSGEETTFFRRVSAFEMVYVYLMLVGLLYGFWRWRKRIEIYLVTVFCTVMMMPFVYGVPNIGSVYRYRYGYLMLLVALGAAVAFESIWTAYQAKNQAGIGLKHDSWISIILIKNLFDWS